MSQYNVLQALYMSFYSPKLYRDVAMNWGGKAFLYLLMLVALAWIVPVFQIQAALNAGYNKHSDYYVQQIPLLTIKDGKISTPENRPYILVEPDGKKPFAIIDTSGRYTTLEQAQTKILLTQTQFITQPKPHETRIDQIPANLNTVIDARVINQYVKDYIGFAWIFFFVVFVLFVYIARIVQALLYGVIGLIFNAIFGAHLRYGQIVPLAMVAITPVIIIFSILEFLSVYIPSSGLVGFALAMIYLCFAIIANRTKVA